MNETTRFLKVNNSNLKRFLLTCVAVACQSPARQFHCQSHSSDNDICSRIYVVYMLYVMILGSLYGGGYILYKAKIGP